MEENNKKGPGVFYAVVGVATLLVAIIGATFAYFSASTSAGDGTIKGSTNDAISNTLGLNVSRVTFDGASANSSDLVPAYNNVTAPASVTGAMINTMLTNKCVNGGYTGCHVYKITATSTQTVDSANLYLTLSTTATDTNAQWAYATFTADETAGTNGVTLSNATLVNGPAAIGGGISGDSVDLHAGASLNSDGKTYYLMVFLNDNSQSQNTQSDTANYAIGTYEGSLSLQALGGKVRASFTG